MKFLAVLVLAFFIAVQASRDWSGIKPKPLHVQPLKAAPVATKIVGGQEAEPHGVAHQVALIGDDGTFCGGSIIKADWVLTAAQCVEGASAVDVIVGAHKILEDEDFRQVIKSDKIVVHEEWNFFNFSNDVAVVHLSKPIALGQTARVISLNREQSTLEGEEALVSGWGRPSDDSEGISRVLRYAIDYLISNERCADFFGTFINENHVCMSGASGRGACDGDSGGPLVIVRDDTPILAGVISFGSKGGCENGYPSVASRVSGFVEWIDKHIN